MEKLMELIGKGQKLAEKRSWLSKGYNDLINKINESLAQIPDMPEDDIEYTLKTWSHDNNYGTLQRKITINLVFDGDAFIVMRLNKENPACNWDVSDIKEPSTKNIRLFASKFPQIIDFFINEVDKINTDNQLAIDTITRLLAKL